MNNGPIIGTLSEKSTHAFLKRYIEPNKEYHEVPVMGYVCDIFNGQEVYEIQTKQFSRLIPKLEKLLPKYQVTIVYPLYKSKEIAWIDKTTGEIISKKKSTIHQNHYDLFEELYSIRKFLSNYNLKLKVIMLEGVEYKYQDGLGKYNHIKATKIDKIPQSVVEIYDYSSLNDFYRLIPYDENDEFTLKELADKIGINQNLTNMMLKILIENLSIVDRIGKRGKAFLYRLKFKNDFYLDEFDDFESGVNY